MHHLATEQVNAAPGSGKMFHYRKSSGRRALLNSEDEAFVEAATESVESRELSATSILAGPNSVDEFGTAHYGFPSDAVMAARNGYLSDSGMNYLCYPDGCDQHAVEDAACRNDICDDNFGDCCLDPGEQPACLRGYHPVLADRISNYPGIREGFPQGGLSFKLGGCPVEQTFECCRPTTTTTTTAEPLIDAMCRGVNGQLDGACIEREWQYHEERSWEECADDIDGLAAQHNSTMCDDLANGTYNSHSCDYFDQATLQSWMNATNTTSSMLKAQSLKNTFDKYNGFYLWQLCPRSCGYCVEAGYPTTWKKKDEPSQGYGCHSHLMATFNSSNASADGGPLAGHDGHVGNEFVSATQCGQRCVDYNNALARVRASAGYAAAAGVTLTQAQEALGCRAVEYNYDSGHCELCQDSRPDNLIAGEAGYVWNSDKGPLGYYELPKMSTGGMPPAPEFCPDGTGITSEYDCRLAGVEMGGFDVDA